MSLIKTAHRTEDTREVRYGVFLRPDPSTSWALTQLGLALKHQFGLVSALAFPPHATIVGNVALGAPLGDLVDALDVVLKDRSAIEVFTSRVERTQEGLFKDTLRCAITHRADGSVNAPLSDLAAIVKGAVLELSIPVDDYLTIPLASYSFHGHFSIASHELAVDAGMADEVEEFVRGLPIRVPASFTAEWITLIELRADWKASWWEDQSWRQIRSWKLHPQA